jgi:hypothetical protein
VLFRRKQINSQRIPKPLIEERRLPGSTRAKEEEAPLRK